MSYLRKQKDACGRYTPKPMQADKSTVYEDEGSIPMQDQIDNLRAKISLKEKYNKALQEELLESNAGAASMITELTQQNKQYREDLMVAKTAEKIAVKKALRSYRAFQLAVSEKTAEGVINWLDDKLFDLSKQLNEGVYKLKVMQTRLQEAEESLQHLENCPLPGAEPWERKITEEMTALECSIESTRGLHGTASIINRKYREILTSLKMERGKWPNVTNQLEQSLNILQAELASLEAMYEDAKRFRDEAQEKLKLTEEEAHENRRQRRAQMLKMKRSVEKALKANSAKYAANPAISSTPIRNSSSQAPENSGNGPQILMDMKRKQALLQEYEDSVNRLVDVMRVRDVRQCPGRLATIRKVAEMMKQEMALQEEMKDLLTKHKYRLQLILYYFRYSGDVKREEYNDKIEEKEDKLKTIADEDQERIFETSKDGEILSNLRFVMIGMEEQLSQGKKKQTPSSPDLKENLKRIVEKIKQLVDSLEEMRELFPNPPHRSYAPFVKLNHTTNRHIRSGSLDEVEADDSDQELDIPDSNIPNRQELKHASERFHSQALLRRGIK